MSDQPAVETEQTSAPLYHNYPVQLTVKYSEKLNRLTTLFRLILMIPFYIFLESFVFHIDFGMLLAHFINKGKHSQAAQTLNNMQHSVGQPAVHHAHASMMHHQTPAGLFVSMGYVLLPVFLMVVFRKKYPKWIFDFNVNLLALFQRFFAYLYCLTDKYPSSEAGGVVEVSIVYPEPGQLNRFLPFVKPLLVIPHIICLVVLAPFCLLAALISWLVVVIAGKYPRVFFDFVVGYMRWTIRVIAYALLFMTDVYPPFSLKYKD